MITDELNDGLRNEIGIFLEAQTKDMLSAQLGISRSVYSERTGTLNRALSSKDYTVSGMTVDIRYPKHIRFLDMKKSASGRKKLRYSPIYNRYVYGYLKSAIWKKLKRAVPAHLIQQWKDSFGPEFLGGK